MAAPDQLVYSPADERTATDPRNEFGQNPVAQTIAIVRLRPRIRRFTHFLPLSNGVNPFIESGKARILTALILRIRLAAQFSLPPTCP